MFKSTFILLVAGLFVLTSANTIYDRNGYPISHPNEALLSIASNVTVVKVGQPFTVRCDIAKFDPASLGKATDSYAVSLKIQYAYRSSAVEYTSYRIAADNSDHFEVTPFTPNGNCYGCEDDEVAISPGRYNLSSYEFTVLPKRVGLKEIHCHLDQNFKGQPFSPFRLQRFSSHHNVSSLYLLPSATLSSNVKAVTVGKSFALACQLGHFRQTDHFLVHFFSRRDGLLATYDDKANSFTSQPLLSIKKHSKVKVDFGRAAVSFPRYEVQIQELILADAKQQEYWCALEDVTTGIYVESTKWPNRPVVQFTAVKTSKTGRMADCFVDNLQPSGVAYSVRFIGQLEGGPVTSLASFTVEADQREKFEAEPAVAHWAKVTYDEESIGGGSATGHFEVNAELDAPRNGSWWCVLDVVGQVGVIKSNVVAL